MKYNLGKTKFNNITLVIVPTRYLDYDILAIGSLPLLTELKANNKDFILIKKSRFGGIPVLVMDTSDTLRGCLTCIKTYKKLHKMVAFEIVALKD